MTPIGELEIATRLLLAALVGVVLGFERELRPTDV